MYVSLHNRSAYSFESSLIRPDQLAAFAASQSMPAIALTDLHGLYAAVPFQQACERQGIRPIFGAELKLAHDAAVTLLAETAAGYGNLCRLISLHHLRDEPLGTTDLCTCAEGLICLVGRLPDVRMLSDLCLRLRFAFEGRLYVELCIHDADDVLTARRRAQAADEMGLPVVATCEARAVRRDQGLLLRAVSSVGTLTLLNQPHSDKPRGDWHLRTAAEMQRLFARRPDALVHTRAIAERCAMRLDLGRNRFPSFTSADERSAIEHLRERCVAGCRWRCVEQPPLRGIGGKRPTLAEALQRLERELAVIDQVHYAEYFLVFDEIVRYCRGQGIATLARGSAADSLVCYALGVSHACPFRFDLPFDRFLNTERAKFSKMADIDLDLPWDRRDQVIRWVYERWGSDRVAMIGASNTFHARAAVVDLGKVYGLPPHELHQATRLMGYMTSCNLSQAIAGSPEAAREIPVHEQPYRTILRMAAEIDGLPRHWSMHPCGLVISPEPLTDLVPVQRSPKGPLVAQYEMEAIEDLGFIKIDLLGQAGLSVLRDAIAEIERTQPVRIDLERDVDYSEAAVWDLIAGGKACGVHHIESPAMTSLIRQCNCRDIDCLTTIVAIIRPGASNQGKKELFARRYQGFEPPRYVHPSLEPILRQTYGLMAFEEHILQIAVEFAGMNVGRADVLRRALNKQNRLMIAEMRGEFFRCAQPLGHEPQAIEMVWSLVEGFAGFMFNKAHSAEYAIEAFQGAWLKTRWPAHYLAAVLSNYRGFYAHSPTLPQILYVMEALQSGIGFLPPCVNQSREHFSIEHTPDGRTMIRIPVTHIKGLPQRFLDRYLEQREKATFSSLKDFLLRCQPGQAEVQALLDSGAFDGWGRTRPALFWEARPLLHQYAHQGGLFPCMVQEHLPPIELTCPQVHQRAQREMELLGFPISQDVLSHLGGDQGRAVHDAQYTPIDQLPRFAGRSVTVCGIMVADRINCTQAGELMKFVTLADRTGFMEAYLFPDAYRRFGHLTVAHPILTARGVVEPFENHNGFTFRVQSVAPPAVVQSAAVSLS